MKLKAGNYVRTDDGCIFKIEEMEENLCSIVTKKTFEQMSYKVGE